MDHSEAWSVSLTAGSLYALLVLPTLDDIYKLVGIGAFLVGVVSTVVNLWWKQQDRRREELERQTRRS